MVSIGNENFQSYNHKHLNSPYVDRNRNKHYLDNTTPVYVKSKMATIEPSSPKYFSKIGSDLIKKTPFNNMDNFIEQNKKRIIIRENAINEINSNASIRKKNMRAISIDELDGKHFLQNISVINTKPELNNSIDHSKYSPLRHKPFHKNSSHLNEIKDKISFTRIMKLFEINLEIDEAINNYGRGDKIFVYNSSSPQFPNKNFFIILLRKYFGILQEEFSNDLTENSDLFFETSLNKLYEKIIKLQVFVFGIFIVCFMHKSLDDYLKNHIKKLSSLLIHPVINFLDLFIISQPAFSEFKEQIGIIFYDKYRRILKYKRINKFYNLHENITVINKSVDELTLLIKQFPGHMYKYPSMKPYYGVVLQLIRDIDKFSSKQLIQIILDNVLYSCLNPFEDDVEKYAISTLEPFLPVMKKGKNYTLVLDLDETLVHYFNTPLSGIFLIRPFAFEFLNELQEMFEIVIFTAGTQDYADVILNRINIKTDSIEHRLYRNHTSFHGNMVTKDLSKLGRDLSKVIIIDNIPENFRFQPNNGLAIKTWNNDMKDTQLLELKNILKDIYVYEVKDVRLVIKGIHQDLFRMKNKSYGNIDVAKFLK